MRHIAFTIVAASLLAACAPGQEPGSQPQADTAQKPASQAAAGPALDNKALGESIKRYYAASGQVPEDVDLVVTEVVDSEIGGLKKGKLKVSKGDQSQDVDFFLSGDGRWFLRADPVDLNVDPVDQVLKAISIGPNDPYLGKVDAAVTIVEYSDFQCPFCARAETIVQEEVLKEYGDKVKFVYKQFPLVQMHPWAQPASVVGLCILKQSGNDAYWKYHKDVFAKQQEIDADNANEKLLAMAKAAGADEAKVKACVESKEAEPIVEATLTEAAAIGVNSTPTFFVNGRRLSGAQPLEAFKAIIDPELQKKS